MKNKVVRKRSSRKNRERPYPTITIELPLIQAHKLLNALRWATMWSRSAERWAFVPGEVESSVKANLNWLVIDLRDKL